MTPRQRWLATLNGDPIDKAATDIWATPECMKSLRDHFGIEGDTYEDDTKVWDNLNIDGVQGVGVPYNGPDLADPEGDLWGVRRKRVGHGTGAYNEIINSPLADAQTVADVERHSWPSPDHFDYTHVAELIDRGGQHRIVRGGGYEPFLICCHIRGMEQAYMDLAMEPEVTEAILQKLFDFHFEQNRRILEAGQGRIDMFYLAEDLGGQHGPLFSLDLYKQFFLPNQIKMAKMVHDHGAKVFYHSDGAMNTFLPLLIEEVGIDVLNPLQWRCPGMELKELVRDFAGDIAFHGGIDNQQTLPFGTAEEVKQEVTDVAKIMSDANARWICAPCHNIQSNTSVENILAMYETADQLAPTYQ